MYIYHNKDLDQYLGFGNLKKLCDTTGVKYGMVSRVFSRKKLLRFDKDNYTIVRFKKANILV